MIDRDDIARAARNNDALTEEIGFEAFLARYEIDVDGILYVSQQRALRMGLIMEGRDPNPAPNVPVAIRLTPPVRALMPVFGSAWMDGFVSGVLARHDSSHDIPGISNDHEHCREIGKCWQDRYPCPALIDPLGDKLRAEVRAALEGDSNDAEHDALQSVAEHLHIDYDPPEE